MGVSTSTKGISGTTYSKPSHINKDIARAYMFFLGFLGFILFVVLAPFISTDSPISISIPIPTISLAIPSISVEELPLLIFTLILSAITIIPFIMLLSPNKGKQK